MSSTIRFEDAYIGEIVSAVATEFGVFKRPPSMLLLGGGQWRFGRLVGKQANIERIMYADNNQKSMEEADANQVLTVATEVHCPDAVSTGSKYDVIIMKNTLECIADKLGALDEYIVALYKTLKLNGIAVLITRMQPTLPLPAKVIEQWNKCVPDEKKFNEAVEKADLGINVHIAKIAKTGIKVPKADWLDGVKHLPFTSGLTDKEILDACAKQTQGDNVTINNTVHVITLAKNIKRVVRGDDGMITNNGVE